MRFTYYYYPTIVICDTKSYLPVKLWWIKIFLSLADRHIDHQLVMSAGGFQMPGSGPPGYDAGGYPPPQGVYPPVQQQPGAQMMAPMHGGDDQVIIIKNSVSAIIFDMYKFFVPINQIITN